MNFKQTVKKEIDKQGKSWLWLSEQLGVSYGNVHNIMRKPSHDTIVRIGKALDKEYLKIFM